MSKPKVGKAFVFIVDIQCPYCGSGDVIDSETGSCMVEWRSTSPLTCNDCEKECLRPKKVTA
jgi:hypothetical protein